MNSKAYDDKTLSERASKQLAQAIIRGELAQGQKLSESELAVQLGISRGPLREAIRRLEGMHLVKRIPHAGARVISLDNTMMAELYTVREALEGMACRKAAENGTKKDHQQLFELLQQHEKQIKADAGQHYRQSESDFDFHYHIARCSNNQMLMDLLTGDMYQLLRMCRYRTSSLHKRPQIALEQHRQIAEAIAARDGELAELLMRRHISGAWSTIQPILEQESSSCHKKPH